MIKTLTVETMFVKKFVVLLFVSLSRGHYVKKCCPEGERLAIPPKSEDTKVKCIAAGQSSQNPKDPGNEKTSQISFESFNGTTTSQNLTLLFPNNSKADEGSFEVLVASTNVCGGHKIKDPVKVKEIYTDGFVIDNWNYELPYDCVDFVSSSDEHPTGIFCNKNQRPPCPKDRTCVEKCCRHGKLLVHDNSRDRLECQESDHLMWSPNSYKRRSDDLVEETIFLFYKWGNSEVCYTSRSEYEIQPNGSLYNHQNKSFTNDFCIDNYVEELWREAKEVVVTLPENCHKVRENEDGVEISAVLHIAATCISLVALVLTFLYYVLVTSHKTVKRRIVLLNLVFTSLLFGFLILSHFTTSDSFYWECSLTNSVCKFLSRYCCAVIGYIGYFLYIATFSWITVFGFNFFWNIYSGLNPHDSSSRSDSPFGFPTQLAAVPGKSL